MDSHLEYSWLMTCAALRCAGLATVGGVCLDRYACVIAELGTVNVFGKPYPSAGFTSVYILAHEIGHK